MSGMTAATHCDADAPKLLADCGRGNAQLGTDLAQGRTLGTQVGRTLNVHGGSVTVARPPADLRRMAPP